ncbi:MAG: cupin domain-containing protein [Candidatus Dojkabacteria bacterium]
MNYNLDDLRKRYRIILIVVNFIRMNRSKVGYIADIEEETLSNDNFRKVVYTTPLMQLVTMMLKPKEEIGMEVHETSDQFFRIESGTAQVILNGEENILKSNDVLIVPAGTNHNIINNSDSEILSLYTIYTPPTHPAGTVEKEKPSE